MYSQLLSLSFVPCKLAFQFGIGLGCRERTSYLVVDKQQLNFKRIEINLCVCVACK